MLYCLQENQERWFFTYVDSGYGRDLNTRQSTLGILYKIGDALIAWSNKLQPIILSIIKTFH
jgi:hypothetical protein